MLLGWKLSLVAFCNVNAQQNTTGLSFQPNGSPIQQCFRYKFTINLNELHWIEMFFPIQFTIQFFNTSNTLQSFVSFEGRYHAIRLETKSGRIS